MRLKEPKARLAELLDRIGLLDRLHFGNAGRLIVFNYHRIRPEDPTFSTPFDDGVFGPTVSEFEDQIRWLKCHTRILSEKELIDVLDSGRPPAGLCTMVTFDDGYLDNYTLAWPVLRTHEVPAVFFIPTRLISERQLGWWDLISYLVKQTTKDSIRYNGDVFDLSDRRLVTAVFKQKMTLDKQEHTRDLVPRLSEACAVDLPDAAAQAAELMSWEQIREVAGTLITIGSHSHSHAALATIPAEQQRQELAQSKRILETELKTEVRSVAYPVGGYAHFTPETQQLAGECGYRIGYSFATGPNRWGQIQEFDVRRVSAPLSKPFLVAKANVPGFFATS